jgi:hypothetical protein
MANSIIKVFNTTGPCVPSEHYMLPVLSRVPGVDEMVSGKYYFIIHAPRQSGKTTYLKILTDQINLEGKYYALYCSLESLDEITNRKEGINEIIFQIQDALLNSEIDELIKLSLNYKPLQKLGSTTKVKALFNYLCNNIDKDLIVFFDETDCLSEEPLVTFLRQIRLGYNTRTPKNTNKLRFPRTVALIGMRDIRDYIKRTRPESQSRGLASPFNIKRKALTLRNFTQEEIKTLYSQHTKASGQIFEGESIERAWFWSEGQPWLVNALALETVVEILHNDYSLPVTKNLIDQAAEAIIKRRDTHIDSLRERLSEPRVINVMDSVLAGTQGKVLKNPDDKLYCIDLGLVVEDENQKLRPANPIYSEVMVRMLTDEVQSAFDDQITKINWHNGQIIFMTKILKQFQTFWRQNAFTFPLRINQLDSNIHEIIQKELDSLPLVNELTESDSLSFILRVKDAIARQYDEAAYSLLLMAFLQKVVNSGALVHRQFSQGRGSVDLCVIYKQHKYLVEVKLLGQKSLDDSLKQLSGYLDISSENEGWLVIFDRNRMKSWDEKIYWNTQEFEGKIIHIVGC